MSYQDAAEFDGHVACRVHNDMAGARVAVFRLAHRPGVQKQHAIDTLRVRLVCVLLRQPTPSEPARVAQPRDRPPEAVIASATENSQVVAAAPASCAMMNIGTSMSLMPANVSVTALASVTAGFADEVEAVNRYAEVM